MSDIHGNLKTLDLIKYAINKYPHAMFVAGCDYIDSHLNSREVMDFLIDISRNNYAIILKGNYEELMINFADGLNNFDDPLWFANGCKRTVRSFFGRSFSKERVAFNIRHSKYYDFAKALPVMYDTPNIIFVHAGVKPVKNYNDPNIFCRQF